MKRPPLLSLDGLDGTGKSTQIRLLADWLEGRGWPVLCCADPGGTPLGDELRSILLTRKRDMSPMAEALLFMASRAELLARVIRPALESGNLVLCDRYLLANVVYQGHGAGLDVDRLWTLGKAAAEDMLPDLTIVLDLQVEASQQRRGRSPDRMEARHREFHDRVRQGYLTEAGRQPDRIRVVDASGDIFEVQAKIRAEVERVVGPGPRA